MNDINEKYCRAYVSQHDEGWEERIFENYNLQNYLETLDSLDSDVVICTARTHTGYWFTDIGLGEMHPGLHGIDQLQEVVDYFHKRGKLVIAYFSVVYDKKIIEMHPEWAEVNRDGTRFHGDTTRVACMNSPYRESVINMVETLFRKKDIDGILIDMPFYENKVCYCQSCQNQFRMRYNCSLPETEDYSDEGYRNYFKMRHHANTTFVQELIDTVKAIKPDAYVYPQCDLLKVNQRNSQDFEIARMGDYIYSDLYFEFGTAQISIATKFYTKLTKNLPEIGIMTRPGTHNDTPNMMSQEQINSEVVTILANGGAVHLFDIMWPDGHMQKDMWERNANAFREIKKRTPWLGGKSVAQVAVYHSEQNYLWYGNDDNEGRVVANVYGMCRALMESHIPHDIIPELSAEILKPYDVLILPNTACLSDKECNIIREYVKNGGGLVCTNRTSLLDEKGNARENYGLSDVLGVDYIGADTAAYSRVYDKFDVNHGITEDLPSDGMITSWGVTPKIKAKDAKVLATVVFPYTEPTSHRFINALSNPPAVKSNWPACTINQYGEGTVIYFAGQPEKDLIKYSFPEQRMLLRNAAYLVMRKPKKVWVDEEQPLEVTLYENRNGQYVVHLVNQLYDYGRTMNNTGPWDLGVDKAKESIFSRQNVQHVYPLSNVKVKIHVDKPIYSLTLEPSHQNLEFAQNGDYVETVVPFIKYHEMIIVE